MQTMTIGGKEFARMLSGGACKLAAYRQDINDLNVFPIPDGDTGDNMLMTFGSGADAAKNAGSDLGSKAKAAAEGMLLGARGNSGVILSRIFAGITSELKDLETAEFEDIKRGMKSGVTQAYGAVSKPVEGTILTVFKDAVTYANEQSCGGLENYFDELLGEMGRSLDRTPDLLPVLAEAGVVDSGGAGLYYIFEGMKEALEKGDDFEYETSGAKPQTQGTVDFSLFDENSVLEFGYCTEFLLRLQRAKTDVETFKKEELTDYLNSVGDSVVCFRDGSIVKVHVHTKDPGGVLRHCQKFGEFLTLKIENMTLQHSEAVTKGDNAQAKLAAAGKKRKKTGIVAVAAGKGIKQTFLSLGVDEVVDGGQSMNPSAGDMIVAFDKVNAERIFVFPNNGNVILTAEQAAGLYGKSEVKVIKTKTVGDGYAAVSMMETDGKTEDIEESIYSSIKDVVTACVSKANRSTEKNGVSVVSGDYIGFVGDDILSDDCDKIRAAEKMLDGINASESGLMLCFTGENASKDETEKLHKILEKKYPETEILFIEGDQPIYDYMFVLE